jgi:mannose-1-phosphate guanylyltransferase
MHSVGDTWAIVLAGGDGRRLHALTTTLGGVTVPKQYCSLWGGPSLLEDALVRAAAIAPLQRICTVVAAAHRRWWSTSLAQQAGENIIVQPRNRGTGIGILLALLHVIERDPYANVVLLPADHYLRDERTMLASLERLAFLAADDTDSVHLLGAEAGAPDSELGYIVPEERRRDAPSRVRCFVEKPSVTRAEALVAEGALVNVFIVAGSVGTLLGMYKKLHSREVMALGGALRAAGGDFGQLAHTYDQLAEVDFSRDVLTRQTSVLRVLPVPPCGWTDLGTPERLAEVLKVPPRQASLAGHRSTGSGYLNLAAQWQGQE